MIRGKIVINQYFVKSSNGVNGKVKNWCTLQNFKWIAAKENSFGTFLIKCKTSGGQWIFTLYTVKPLIIIMLRPN